MKKQLLFTFMSAVFLMGNVNELLAQHAKDLQLFSWSSPRSKGALTDNESVRFTIKNVGTEPVSNFTLGFSQDGGSTFKEEVITQTIEANKYLTYTFTSHFAVVGIDGATYPIVGKITLEGDEDLSNNEHTENVINYSIGDVDDEPFWINSFPYSDTQEYVMFTGNYGEKFAMVNYMQQEDIVYAFTTTETQMYVDAEVTASWAGLFSPNPCVVLINEKPSTFNKYSTGYGPGDTELGKGYGDWSGSFENAYCYSAQTYYIIVDKWREYSCTYDLKVNLYRQHDFKSFNFESLSVEGDIDYDNRIVTLAVPAGTDVTALVATYELPAYTEVLVKGITQTSGSSSIDFTNDVTYTINQTISPNTSQSWTIKVVEETPTNVKSEILESISIAPNPAHNEIYINSEKNVLIDKVSIYNTSGSLILSESDIESGISLPVSNFSPGIYFIHIRENGHEIIKKFIKK